MADQQPSPEQQPVPEQQPAAAEPPVPPVSPVPQVPPAPPVPPVPPVPPMPQGPVGSFLAASEYRGRGSGNTGSTILSSVLLVLAGLLVPMALWVSLWGGYGGTTGQAIGLWVAIILLWLIAVGLSLTFGPGLRVSAEGSRIPVVAGSLLVTLAVLEGFVLLVNLSGGYLRVPLAIILVVLIGLGSLALWLGLRQPPTRL